MMRVPAVQILVVVGCLVGALAEPSTLRSEMPPVSKDLQDGLDHLAARRWEDAVKAFKRANSLAGDRCAPCLVNMAEAQQAMGDLRGARKTAEKAIPLAVEDPQLRARAQNIVGLAMLRLAGKDNKRLREAEQAFHAALELDPQNANFRFNLGYALLRQSRDEEGISELRPLLERSLEPSLAANVGKLIANPRRARERFAPDFRVTTAAGEEISSESLLGKVVVLDFWATWCPPCRESVPELKELARKYPTERLALISVSVDEDEAAWRQFVARNGMSWPQYRDREGALTRQFGVNSFPTYLVIDGEGVIRQELTGLRPNLSLVGRLRSTLETLIVPARR